MAKNIAYYHVGAGEVRRRYAEIPSGTLVYLPTDKTPLAGDEVIYWQCGGDNVRSFVMPPVGGSVTLRDGNRGRRFLINSAEFVRSEIVAWTEETAVGNTPASECTFNRVR